MSVITPTLGMRTSSTYFLNNLQNIEVLRTFVYASAAAYARIRSAVLRGIINEFVHESLSESLHLGVSGICRRHLREVPVHAGIPASETDGARIGLEISYVETLAGRAYESTCAAA